MKKDKSMHPKTQDFLDKIDLEKRIDKLQKKYKRLSGDGLKLVAYIDELEQLLKKAVENFGPLVHLLPEASASDVQKTAIKTHQEMAKFIKLYMS
jgi:hypothetical protein